jgi:Response regulator containing a CheY-like receiver domain and a GGDEF domain
MREKTILVIDDSEITRKMLCKKLERNGFSTIGATSGKDGLTKVSTFSPDLIVLDVLLPDMGGFEVCDRLKADEQTKDIPIIFATSLDDHANKLRGLSIGGVDYITKPVDPAELLARINIQFRQQDEHDKLFDTQREKLVALSAAHKNFLTDLSTLPESRCAVYFEPAEEAGGDQYDVVSLGSSRFGYCVSDISGHGVEAGLQSSVFKAFFRENAAASSSPVENFQKLNVLMSDYLSDGQHITASYLELDRDKGRAIYLSAGHLPLLVTDAYGEVNELRAEGDVLGAFIAPIFKPLEARLEKGQRFWLFTDGVIEDFGARRSWKKGLEELKAMLPRFAKRPIGEAVDALAAELFPRHPGGDDRVILACEA